MASQVNYYKAHEIENVMFPGPVTRTEKYDFEFNIEAEFIITAKASIQAPK